MLGGSGIFEFSDVVLSVLLGTTTANVLGLGFIMLNDLFPKDCCN